MQSEPPQHPSKFQTFYVSTLGSPVNTLSVAFRGYPKGEKMPQQTEVSKKARIVSLSPGIP